MLFRYRAKETAQTASTSVLNHPLMVTLNIKVTSTDPKSLRSSHLINHFNYWVCFCVCVYMCVCCVVWQQYHPPLRKQTPIRRRGGKRGIKDKRKEPSYEHFWHSSAPRSSRIFYRGSGRSSQEPLEQDPAGSPAFSLLARAELNWLSADHKRGRAH